MDYYLMYFVYKFFYQMENIMLIFLEKANTYLHFKFFNNIYNFVHQIFKNHTIYVKLH